MAATRAQGFQVLVYEMFRTLQRQKYLYAIGRTVPPLGRYVTYTLDSCHRMALLPTSFQSMPKAAPCGTGTTRCTVPPAAFGLELLAFERPYLQLAGGQLRARHLGIKPDLRVGSTHVVAKTRGLAAFTEPELPLQWQQAAKRSKQ